MSKTRWLLEVAEDWLRRKGREVDPESLFPGGLPDTPIEAWSVVAQKLGISLHELALEIAAKYGLKVADLGAAEPGATRLISDSVARRNLVMPIRDDGRELELAVSNPLDEEALRVIGLSAHRKIVALVAPPEEIDNAILSNYYDRADAEREQSFEGKKVIDVSSADWKSAHPKEEGGEADSHVVRLVSMLIRSAIERRASDIHLQPFLGGGVVRFRIDGVLRRMSSLPPSVARSIILRVKAVAGMDTANRVSPQDGSFRAVYGRKMYDLRVSTLPVGNTERLVVRLLDQSTVWSLDELEIREPENSRLRALLGVRAGLLIIAGPTGSGKTTTLYASLAESNTVDRNIITVEDPVEYKLPGISQVEVEEKQGLTFASALRSILRQDPDILLIGEVRDPETAKYAFRAGLTGHVVLTTLHTTDVFTAIERLRDLEIDSLKIARTVRALTSQRLMRKLCDQCAVPVEDPLTAAEKEFARMTGEAPARRAVGCAACEATGYFGRQVIAQVLEVDEALADLFQTDAGPAEIKDAAKANGLRSLGTAAAETVQDGTTTVEEAQRVLGRQFWTDLASDSGVTVKPTEIYDTAIEDDEKMYAGAPRVLLLAPPGENLDQALNQLQDGGCLVSVADSVAKANALEEQHAYFDALVLDFTQPETLGLNALYELSLWKTLGSSIVPAMAIVRDDDNELGEQVLSLKGASDYIFASQVSLGLADAVRGLIQKSVIAAASHVEGAAQPQTLESP